MSKSKSKEAPSEKKKGSAKKWIVRIGVGVACALFAIFLLYLVGHEHLEFLSVVMAAVSALAMHEVMGVSGCKNKVITYITMIFAACVPLYVGFDIRERLPEALTPGVIVGIYIIVVLVIMLKMYDKTRFEHVAIGLFMSIAVPMAISTLLLLFDFMNARRDIFCMSQTVYVLLMAMYCAWLSDTFALFVGSACGKHKMAPKISPNKSIEGAIGGVVGTTVIALITYFICYKCYFHADVIGTIRWWMVLIIIPCVCVAGMCGDLAASVIKRNYGVKDFGTLLPEHGGAMDRVDSFLFTMPVTYIIVKLLVGFFA